MYLEWVQSGKFCREWVQSTKFCTGWCKQPLALPNHSRQWEQNRGEPGISRFKPMKIFGQPSASTGILHWMTQALVMPLCLNCFHLSEKKEDGTIFVCLNLIPLWSITLQWESPKSEMKFRGGHCPWGIVHVFCEYCNVIAERTAEFCPFCVQSCKGVAGYVPLLSLPTFCELNNALSLHYNPISWIGPGNWLPAFADGNKQRDAC